VVAVTGGGRLVRLVARQPLVSDGFSAWLESERVGVVFATGGRLCVVGRPPDGSTVTTDQSIGDGVTTVVASSDGLLATSWQLWRFVDALAPPATTPEGHDRLLLPQVGAVLGGIAVCDLAEGDGHIRLASTRLGCLATVDDHFSVRPLWTPSWQSAIADEDRCHVAGFADAWDRTWVSCAGRTDTADGWRAGRVGGGLVVSTAADELVDGLTMPTTIRSHEGRLLVVDAGAGELLSVDRDGSRDTVLGWPALLGGLAVHHDHAVIGAGWPDPDADRDLPVAARAGTSDALLLVDLRTGRVDGTLELEGRSQGVTSIAVLEGARWPLVATPRGPTGRNTVMVGPTQPL
jgi:protein O-GlcNAc transferase